MTGAADYWSALDIAFEQRPWKNWYRYTNEQREEWSVMEAANSDMRQATYDRDKV